MFFFRYLTLKRIESAVRGASFTVLLMLLLLTGCSQGDTVTNVTGNLNGVWKDSYGTITINSSQETIKYSDNYEGTIKNSPNYTASNGVLIIQFTKYWEWQEVDGEWVSEENPASECITKFGALYWKDLTIDSVYIADAYSGLTHTMFDTLAKAQTNFTIDKTGSYIDWSILAPYTK